MEKIKDTIYVETEYLGCNPSFIVTSNGIVMIDAPGLKLLEALEWKKEIEKYGDITYIINTDHHLDHATGNYFFSGDIIIHEGTMRKLFAKDRIENVKKFLKLTDLQSECFMEHYFIKKPKFNNRMNIYLGEEMFELIHIRGHTEDETIVYMPLKKVLFSGDNVCTNGIPNLRESFPFEWLEALESMEKMDIDVLIPGHGEIGNKESIKQFRIGLSSLLNRVKEKIDKGFSRDDVVRVVSYEDNIHRKYPPKTSEMFHQMMEMSIARLYDALTRKSG